MDSCSWYHSQSEVALLDLSAHGWPAEEKGRNMKKPSKPKKKPDMRPEYDFSQGKRGQFAKRFAKGTNLVLLRPEVAAAYPDSDAVNRTLLKLMAEKK